MDTRILREFLVLAQTENFLEASDLLYISQPTLSRHIMSLEDELGVPLFERSTRYVRLNQYGKMLVPFANQFLNSLTQFNNSLLAEKRSRDTLLNVAVIPAMNEYCITEILLLFRQEHPEYGLNIIPCYNEPVISKVRSKECSFGFIRESAVNNSDDLGRIEFDTDTLIAVVPADHPLAQREHINLSDLRNTDIVTLSQETLVFDIIRNACMKNGFEPHVSVSDHKLDYLMDCVLLGLGVGLFFDRQLKNRNADPSSYKVLRVSPSYHTKIALYYLKESPTPEISKAFLETYYNYKAMHNIKE